MQPVRTGYISLDSFLELSHTVLKRNVRESTTVFFWGRLNLVGGGGSRLFFFPGCPLFPSG